MKNTIFEGERKILDWIRARLIFFAAAALTLLGLLIRYTLRDFVSPDYTFYLEPWFNEIKSAGISAPVGNYNLPYQFIIFLLTKLPISSLYSYKLLSCAFDIFLALGAAALTYELSQNGRAWKALAAYGLTLLSPIVFLNSAAWAQCDSIFVCFALFALLFLIKERYPASFVFLGLAFAFKLQAVFILPLFLFAYFASEKFSVLYFLITPTTMIAASSPALFCGRSLLEVFTIYAEQTDYYSRMIMNYPSVWALLLDGSSTSHYGYMKTAAIVLTVCALLGIMLLWFKKNLRAEGENLLLMAFILSFTCVLLLPGMHERYGFIYEILAICIAVRKPGTAPLCAALTGISLCTYGAYLFGITAFAMPWLSALNILIYTLYFIRLTKEMSE